MSALVLEGRRGKEREEVVRRWMDGGRKHFLLELERLKIIMKCLCIILSNQLYSALR